MINVGRLLTPAFFLGCWLSAHVVTPQHLENAESDATRLKTYWEQFEDGQVGCEGHGEITYKWRANDWENNIVELLLAWSHGILDGHLDIAVVLEPGDGEDGAGTTAESGWSPFFLPMPHLCVFDNQQDWEDYMAASGAAAEVQEAALSNLEKDIDRGEDPTMMNPLQSGGTDLVQSMTMGLEALLSYTQPSVTDDARSFLLGETDTADFATVQYVGMHVRDIPPRMFGTYKATETLDCFERVFKFFEDKDEGVRPSDITGVWIVSEDATSLPEAKHIARRYFRNAKEENVVEIAGPALPEALADPEGDTADAASETGDAVEYDAVVHLVAQLQVLASAEVFVGAFSENLSRLVFLRREALHLPRATSTSTDKLAPFPE